MDLIYMDNNKVDIGVLHQYNFDLAFGNDENDFQLTMDLDKHCCHEGYYIYIEHTEYGGIVDSIEVDSAQRTVTYKGRTWHGILAEKILEPENGQDYLYLSGDANEVIGQVITLCGLDNFFAISDEVTDIEIIQYQVPRYTDAYTVLKDMLFSVTGKLHISFENKTVMLSCVPYIDYSQNEEWDSTQLEFTIEQNFKPVNHLICLGKGDLKDRAVIHLFTDENGGIRPYATTDEPVQDSDYILDKSEQVMFGVDEICEVYDYSSAETTENYILMTEQPANWSRVFPDYYIQDNDARFDALTKEYETTYTVLTSAPSNWSTNYGKYFEVVSGNYVSVSGVSQENYSKLTSSKQPSDWSKNYGNYYYKYSDGVTTEYRKVQSVTKEVHTVQTTKPSDWSTNYASYYTKLSKNKGYAKVEGNTKDTYTKLTTKPSDWDDNYTAYYTKYSDGVEKVYKPVQGDQYYNMVMQFTKPSDWSKNFTNYYTKKYEHEPHDEHTAFTWVKLTGKKAPVWIPDTYYTAYTEYEAPAWKSGKYYSKSSVTNAPKWKKKKYYTKSSKQVAPAYTKNTYYVMTKSIVAPTFQANKYYNETETLIVPAWSPNKYFKLVYDNYAELVEGGLKRLEESLNCDSLEIDLDPTQTYDIGDVVGASEQVTGLSIWQKITKKIVKISNNEINISYKVGD